MRKLKHNLVDIPFRENRTEIMIVRCPYCCWPISLSWNGHDIKRKNKDIPSSVCVESACKHLSEVRTPYQGRQCLAFYHNPQKIKKRDEELMITLGDEKFYKYYYWRSSP